MPTTTNARHLTIASGEPNIESGWSIRVLDYKDMTSLVAVISEFNEFSFTQELNGPGTGSVTIDDDSAFWGSVLLENGGDRRNLQNRVYVFEAWDGGTPRFAWLGQTVENTYAGDDMSRSVVISGPGIAQTLAYAAVGRPGFPTKVPILRYQPSQASPHTPYPIYRAVSSTDSLSAFGWFFPMTWSTMRMWYTVFRAAQRRGLIGWVKPSFTAMKDSASKPFQVVKTIAAITAKKEEERGFQPQEINQTLLEFLADCTGQDYSKWFGQRLEWMMYPGFKLDVRETIGKDRSPTVRFFAGGNILSVERTRDREEIRNRIIAQDVIGNESIRTDKTSVSVWNMREQWNTTNKNVTVDELREQIANRYIKQFKDQKDQWTVKVRYTDTGRIPYRDYFVGDKVGFLWDDDGMIPDYSDGPQVMRILAITIRVGGDDSLPEVELTLQSYIESKIRELEKQITQLLNNPKNVDLNNLKNVTATDPSEGDTLVYNPVTKKWEANPGTSSGNRVFIGPTDPAASNTVQVGDFWFQP